MSLPSFDFSLHVDYVADHHWHLKKRQIMLRRLLNLQLLCRKFQFASPCGVCTVGEE